MVKTGNVDVSRIYLVLISKNTIGYYRKLLWALCVELYKRVGM